MRDRRDEFGDAEVTIVTFTRARNLPGYRSRFVDPLTVVTDETRQAYRDYGLERGSFARVWAPAVWRMYAGLLRRGRRPARPTEDTRQLGGNFVVAADGRLAWVFRSEGPDDRPSVDELLAAVDDCRP